MELPEELGTELLNQVISVIEKDVEATVELQGVERAIPKGNNYLSVIYRIKTKYLKNGSHSVKTYILKSVPHDKSSQGFIKNMGVFEKESYVYEELLPKLHTKLKTISNGFPYTISARYFPVEDENALLFEDLNSSGYTMTNRSSLLDYDHCKLVIRTLAKLHAASLALMEENPAVFENCKESLFAEEKREVVDSLCSEFIKVMCDKIATWEGFEDIGKRLKKMCENMTDLLIDVVKPKSKFPSVFNHGDTWKNNILFKYNEATNKVEDVRFVDFQISRVSSPVLDILYFLYTSVKDEVLEERDKIVEIYHDALMKYLEKFKCNNIKYTAEDMKEDIKDRFIYVIYCCCTLRAGVLMENENAVDLADIVDEEKSMKLKERFDDFISERFVRSLKKILLQMKKDGMLES